MAHVLILVHGMGAHLEGWAEEIVAKLNTVARRYSAFSGPHPVFVSATDARDPRITGTGPQQIVVVPAGYDQGFRDLLAEWDTDANALLRDRRGAVPSPLRASVQSLQGASELERNFLWSHVVDVVLYKYFAEATTQARLAVMETVARVLALRDTRVSVMAHSLGTAVSHDALSLLANGTYPELTYVRPPGVRLANHIAVANVSRILEQKQPLDLDVYESPVAPISVRRRNAYTERFLNFRHQLDPFPHPKRFEPDWVQGDDWVRVDDLLHVAEFNVHGWAHYLDHPSVHVPILNALASTSGWLGVPDGERETAIRNYQAAPIPLCTQGLAWWTEQTRRLRRRLSDTPTVPELVWVGAQFFAVAQLAEHFCRGEVTLQDLGTLTREP